VKSTEQEHGIGKDIVLEILRKIKDDGYNPISCKTWNKTRQMLNLLINLGFNIFGIQYYPDVREIAVLWSLDLTDFNSY